MVGAGENGREDLLARVSLVNLKGDTLYDSFVKPINDIPVTDYRTRFSGVRPADLVNGKLHRPTYYVCYLYPSFHQILLVLIIYYFSYE